MTATYERPRGYQSSIAEYLYEPDQVWLMPTGKGYAVRVGANAKDAIGFVGPIPETERYYEDGELAVFRVHRLDMWGEEFRSAEAAALALIRRTTRGED